MLTTSAHRDEKENVADQHSMHPCALLAAACGGVTTYLCGLKNRLGGRQGTSYYPMVRIRHLPRKFPRHRIATHTVPFHSSETKSQIFWVTLHLYLRPTLFRSYLTESFFKVRDRNTLGVGGGPGVALSLRRVPPSTTPAYRRQ